MGHLTNSTNRRKQLLRTLALFLPIALLTVASAFLVRETELHHKQADQAKKEYESVMAGTLSISHSLRVSSNYLLYITNRIEQLKLFDTSIQSGLGNLALDLSALSQTEMSYEKIRLIDETGKELLRINRPASQPVIAQAVELRDQTDRLVFNETIKLKPGEIYVSQINLEVDSDSINLLPKPTIRFGTPLFDNRGSRRGIALINYSANQLLDRYSSVTSKHGKSDWLVTAEGRLLRGESFKDEFDLKKNSLNEFTLAKLYPVAWKKF